MAFKTSFSKTPELPEAVSRVAANIDRHRAVVSVRVLGLPVATRGSWYSAALGARIAYQMGEVSTAALIVQNSIEEIQSWLPTELKTFALLLYGARQAFYSGDLYSAEDCYAQAYELMTERGMQNALGSTVAELYDEWGESLLLMGFADQAAERYQLAVITDLTCHEKDPRQMSPWRLAKLADYFAVKGQLKDSNLCLELAEAKAESAVERMFVRTYCAAKCS